MAYVAPDKSAATPRAQVGFQEAQPLVVAPVHDLDVAAAGAVIFADFLPGVVPVACAAVVVIHVGNGFKIIGDKDIGQLRVEFVSDLYIIDVEDVFPAQREEVAKRMTVFSAGISRNVIADGLAEPVIGRAGKPG